MKKFFAVLLFAALIMSLTFAASAAEAAGVTHDPVVINKAYTVKGGDGKTIPEETLSFEIQPDASNPADVGITIADVGTAGAEDLIDIKIEFGYYSVMGIYKYVVSEKKGETLAVSYDETPIAVIVTVLNGTPGGDNATDTMNVYVGVYEQNEDGTLGKKITGDNLDGNATFDAAFTNEYKMGKLTVSKKVDGNLASNTKAFDIQVSFTGGARAGAPILYTVSGEEKTLAFNGSDTVSTTVSLKNGESAEFTNIPAGISYTVTEDAKHTQGDISTDEGYTATYANSDNAETGSGYGTVNEADEDSVEITNTKGTVIQTGVLLESLPYILIGVGVVAAVIIIIIVRKRRNDDDD